MVHLVLPEIYMPVVGLDSVSLFVCLFICRSLYIPTVLCKLGGWMPMSYLNINLCAHVELYFV